MGMEHIKFLKGVCGNSYAKQTVSLLCYSRPLQNIKFLQQRAMAGLH